MQAECGRPGADAWSTATELLSTEASEVYHVPTLFLTCQSAARLFIVFQSILEV